MKHRCYRWYCRMALDQAPAKILSSNGGRVQFKHRCYRWYCRMAPGHAPAAAEAAAELGGWGARRGGRIKTRLHHTDRALSTHRLDSDKTAARGASLTATRWTCAAAMRRLSSVSWRARKSRCALLRRMKASAAASCIVELTAQHNLPTYKVKACRHAHRHFETGIGAVTRGGLIVCLLQLAYVVVKLPGGHPVSSARCCAIAWG